MTQAPKTQPHDPFRAILGIAIALALTTLLAGAAEGGGAPDTTPTYLGAKKCKQCHLKVFKSWEQTKMAKSFENLKPGVAKEAKTKAKLDPDKDYTTDAKCLACHTVGFGKPGGYAIPKADDKAAVDAAAALQGVQCESCHGPGSLYVPHKKANEKYARADVEKLGLMKPDEASCKTCHNAESPFVPADGKFDFEKGKKEATHDHAPLKHPH